MGGVKWPCQIASDFHTPCAHAHLTCPLNKRYFNLKIFEKELNLKCLKEDCVHDILLVNYTKYLKENIGAREMLRLLGVFVALAENQCSVSSTHLVAHDHP